MKIAICGSSSTGKTTLLKDLLKTEYFIERKIKHVTLDNRALLSELKMTGKDLEECSDSSRKFQWRILKEKIANEKKYDRFITDRSYLDLAGYWLARTNAFDNETEEYTSLCLELATIYDLHIFLPFGRIPFEKDGYRPENLSFQNSVSEKISELLNGYSTIIANSPDNTHSINLITQALNQ